jgi:hypothetical protein
MRRPSTLFIFDTWSIFYSQLQFEKFKHSFMNFLKNFEKIQTRADRRKAATWRCLVLLDVHLSSPKMFAEIEL